MLHLRRGRVNLLSVLLLVDSVLDLLDELSLLLAEAVLFPGVVHELGIEAVAGHAAFEELDDVVVVGVLCELELAAVLHELLELGRVTVAEVVERRLYLLFFDVVVLLVLAATGQPLPGKTAAEEVEENVADCLEIVTAALLLAKMCVDTCIASCSSQVLSLAVRDMLAIRVLVALCEAKINNENCILVRLIDSN